LCAISAPEIFKLDDVDGHAHAIAWDVPGAQRRADSEAAQSCREQAITDMVEQLVARRAAHGRRLEQ
jgi:hypothetical protein